MNLYTFPGSGGVYGIRNRHTDQYYVGSAVNLRRRVSTHWRHLQKGKHHSRRLQEAWTVYGAGSFEFEVLEEYEGTSSDLRERENDWITELNSYNNGYNMKQSWRAPIVDQRPTELQLRTLAWCLIAMPLFIIALLDSIRRRNLHSPAWAMLGDWVEKAPELFTQESE